MINNTKWALVTGASSGLGAVFAREYAKKGYSLVLTARRREALQTLADELAATHGIDCHVETVDLAVSGAAMQLKQALDEADIVIDVLINNAGMGLHGDFLACPADRLAGMLQLDIIALTELTHLYGQAMAGRGNGQILLISSILGYQATPAYAAYAAAKAYVLSLGEALHEELKASGVTVTVLSPGVTNTEFMAVADQPMPPILKMMLMEPEPVVRAGIKALEAGRASVVPGWLNRVTTQSNRLTPRVMQRRTMAKIMRER